MPHITDNKTLVPLAHYTGVYSRLDPEEAASRCSLCYETLPQGGGFFSLRLLGVERQAFFPEYRLLPSAGPAGDLLVLRFLCEGRLSPAAGSESPFLAYRSLPWGETYFDAFRRRCLQRAAASFGSAEGFERFRYTMEEIFHAKRLPQGDGGYRFEFLGGKNRSLDMEILIWRSDEEFPASAQILFDSNFPSAFTAEDAAVAADLCLSRISSPVYSC